MNSIRCGMEIDRETSSRGKVNEHASQLCEDDHGYEPEYGGFDGRSDDLKGL